jgi:mannose-6-phosphate isomerase-like protein (cupin superfamily)
MRRVVMRAAYGVLLAAICGCAMKPVLVVAPEGNPVETIRVSAWLTAHPLAPEQAFAAAEVWRSRTSSLHVVHIRTAEKPHLHQDYDAVATLLKGQGTFFIGTDEIPLQAGATVTIPRGVRHYFVNGAREPAMALAVFSPPMDQPDWVDAP